MSEDRIRIFIVDDHQMLIDGMKALLKNDKQFEVVGSTTKSIEATGLIVECAPDILLTDVQMPLLDGLELTKEVRKVLPKLKVLVLTMFCDKSMVSEMLNAGVSGYILKNTGKEELKEALIKVQKGGLFFSDEVAAEMMKTTIATFPVNNLVRLTERELEIVRLIAEDFNNAKIAQTLFISERTVETHRKNIFRKTSTHTALGLVKYANEMGLI